MTVYFLSVWLEPRGCQLHPPPACLSAKGAFHWLSGWRSVWVLVYEISLGGLSSPTLHVCIPPCQFSVCVCVCVCVCACVCACVILSAINLIQMCRIIFDLLPKRNMHCVLYFKEGEIIQLDKLIAVYDLRFWEYVLFRPKKIHVFKSNNS